MRRLTLHSSPLPCSRCFAALAVVAAAPAGRLRRRARAAVTRSGLPSRYHRLSRTPCELTLKEPGTVRARACRVSSGGFLPGSLCLRRRAILAARRHRPGSYTFYVTVCWTATISAVRGDSPTPTASSRSTSIPGRRPSRRLTRDDDSLPDANINQPYTSPGLTATGATVSSWSLAGGALPAGLTLGANGVDHRDADPERHLQRHGAGERERCERHEAAVAVRARPARRSRRSSTRRRPSAG